MIFSDCPFLYFKNSFEGSYGHNTAKAYDLTGKKSFPTKQSCESNISEVFIGNKTVQQRKKLHGLAQTRVSVQTLNRLVVSTLLQHGVNAVGISPCFSIPLLQAHGGGDTVEATKQAQEGLVRVVRDTLQAGLVPVLHGDACLYGPEEVGILSGDLLMEILGKQVFVSKAIFITDQDGIFNNDPSQNPNAELLRYVQVDKDSLDIISPQLNASASSHDHDVTGGFKVRYLV